MKRSIFHTWASTSDHVGKSFSVFGIEIAYYGVTIAVAMLAGIFLALHVAKMHRPESG